MRREATGRRIALAVFFLAMCLLAFQLVITRIFSVILWNHFAFHTRTIVDEGSQPAGRHTIVWDGMDDDGNPLGGGVYICRMSVDGQRGESQMIRLPD